MIKKKLNIKSYAYLGTILIKRFIIQMGMQYAILNSSQAVELMSPCQQKNTNAWIACKLSPWKIYKLTPPTPRGDPSFSVLSKTWTQSFGYCMPACTSHTTCPCRELLLLESSQLCILTYHHLYLQLQYS